MFSSKEMPSPSSIFSAYASVAASAMLFRSMANELVPKPARAYLVSALRRLFKSAHSPKLTLVIEDSAGMSRNQLFDAASEYLSSKLSPGTERLKVSKSPKDKSIRIHLEKGEKVSDSFEGQDLAWTFVVSEPASGGDQHPLLRQQERRSFELSFDKRQRQRVLDSYLPFVLEQAREARDRDRVLKMHTLSGGDCGSARWESVGMEHPATFETVAMEGEAKAALVADLERFVKRKEFYRRVGRAWKRGYLLHGPPGTGKSSLVAAIANHLRFDVYDLQLANVTGDSDLRKLLLSTANRSILVIEDIDCSADLPDLRRRNNNNTTARPDRRAAASTLTLSGLLNFIDGLWSSCGDERIIIFTTNHKDRLDPALLRPGRMDMHIHMSYCSFDAFKLLASNYLGICGVHALFAEIEGLIGEAEVTPAQVAEELMRSDDPDAALDGLVQLLKRKRSPVDYEENHAKRRRIAAKNNNNNNKKRVVGLRRRGGLRSDK